MGFGEPHRAASTTYATRDANGRMISKAVHYGPELCLPESITDYEFDATGNWTKRRELSKGAYEERSETVETREITYK